MKLRKAYRFRMRPTKTQEVGLYRMAGARRFVYNWALSRRKDHYAEHGKGISARELSSELTALKSQPETLWLKEADSQMLQQALRDVDRAYDAFFKRRSRFPRLRSKKAGHFTFRIPQRVRVEDGRVYVPKVGWIRIHLSRGVEGTTKSATFKRDACGQWYVALTTEFEIPDVESPAPVNPVGVDLGLKDLFVLSDGERVPAPRFARTAERRLGRVQKNLSRKKPGSRRREKAKRRVARVHRKVSNQRRDFLHKLTTDLTREYDLICLEDLNTRGMAQLSGLRHASWAHLYSTSFEESIHCTLGYAERPRYLFTGLSRKVAGTRFLLLLFCEFVGLFRFGLYIRVRPSVMAFIEPSQEFECSSLLQAVGFGEGCWIVELVDCSFGISQSAGLLASSDCHAVFLSCFRRSKMFPNSVANSLPSLFGKPHTSIGSRSGSDVEQRYSRLSVEVNSLLFQGVARFGVRFPLVNGEDKGFLSVLVPSGLKMMITVRVPTQLALVLKESVFDIETLADIDAPVCLAGNRVYASCHVLIITFSTKLSRSVLDAAFGEFVRQVEYKAAWSFKHSVRVGRFFPSTKLCSECGALNPNLRLVDRTWLCSSCGTEHDRDLNAARNILAEGIRVLAAGQMESQNARGEPVSLPRGSTAR